ncbi:unnamed protein product [Dovyalis caffra]|uniref:Protein N-lysine methyltransferase METTL21A n=1 Tax=Dovyalis caffra TaxID=77055 RepID=A0AAV1RAV6_9ROSI|nr:unnamed protein product [Dovyalis caffra]
MIVKLVFWAFDECFSASSVLRLICIRSRLPFCLHYGDMIAVIVDPNSKHLGTTVWDASMVLVKFLVSCLLFLHALETVEHAFPGVVVDSWLLYPGLRERNCRKGRFCPSKLKGKRVIELGAGCGVAGFGMALLGCDVIATDQIEVLPLLIRNAERNTSRIMQIDSSSDSFGSIQVEELNWGNEDHIRAVDPPFDCIIGTDVVYAEHLLEPLLQTILALSGPKTTILLGYEIRSTNVHERMLDMWKRNFEVKTVPKSKMDSNYQHPSIQLYIMGLKPPAGCIGNMISGIEQQTDEVETVDKVLEEDENGCSNNTKSRLKDCCSEKVHEDCELAMKFPNAKLTDWEARRLGSMAARLLQDMCVSLLFNCTDWLWDALGASTWCHLGYWELRSGKWDLRGQFQYAEAAIIA